MLSGISTACLYPEYTETALKTILSHPVQAVEIFTNCKQELSAGILSEMRKRADDCGTKILSVHPYTSGMEPMYFFSGYQRRFQEGIDLYKQYYQACNILGADIVVFHGDTRDSRLSYSEYFERFGKLVDDASTYGVSLCHENVSRCVGYSPDFFTALAAELPNAQFVLDVKQAVRSGQDVFNFAKSMGNRIKHVHISDNTCRSDCLAPGQGDFNIAKLLDIITSNGFDGGVIVELYRDNFDGIVEIFNGYQHILSHLSTYSQND